MAILTSLAISNAQIFITELADPNNDAGARYVELYNAGPTAVDLGSGYKLQRYTNYNPYPQDSVPLSGIIPAGGFFLVVPDEDNFYAVYGLFADQDIGTGGPADSNGDDNIQLLDPSNNVIDIFGVPGEDGSGTDHEFEDGRAERMDTVTVGKTTYNAGEWNIWNDNTPGDERTAPDDFDPGYWGGDALNAEPDNHVTSFTAAALDFSTVQVSWTDATGTNEAFGYVVRGSSVSYADIADPVDGTPLADDALTINVKPGVQVAAFTGLTDNTTYYFKIFPNSNYASDINYKTDGTVPQAEATTPMAGDFILTEDFESGLSWTAVSDTGDQVWEHDAGEGGNGTSSSVEINGYSGSSQYNVDWLIAPPVNLDAFTGEVMNFYHEWQYGNQDDYNYLKLLYSTDYSGNGIPQEATWSELAFTPGAYNTWSKTEDIDISGISAPTVYFAFKYKSLDDARRWNVDEVVALGTYTGDATAPVFNPGSPRTDDVRENQFDIVANLNEVGTVFYLVQNDGDPAPDIATVRSADTLEIYTANADFSTTIDTVSISSSYDVYFVAIDSAGNIQASLTQIDVSTKGPREIEMTHPVGDEYFYVGDTVKVTWTSSNIDSVSIYVDIFEGQGWFLLEEEEPKIGADLGEFPVYIPIDAGVDSVRMLIADSEDFTVSDSSGTFYLTDTIRPRVELLLPMNKSANVSLLPKLSMIFNEWIAPGSGNISVYEDDGTLVEAINVTGGQVETIDEDGYRAVIEVSKRLANETKYYVLVDAGAFVDNQDNGFAGITQDTTWTFTTMGADLFFSEYVEGSGYNKALEIYNATGSDADLAAYQIWLARNGDEWASATPYPLSGTLKADSVLVICDDRADAEVLALADIIGGGLAGAVNFNGNDPVGLFKQAGMDWILVDVIGKAGLNVANGYDVAGIGEATKDHTLIRKDFIMTGNPDWESSAGSDGFDSEWRVYEQNYFENLGLVSPPSSTEAEIDSFKLAEQTGPATINSGAATVDIEVINGTDLSSLEPDIYISERAMVDPPSGEPADFSEGSVVFTVTAEDRTTTKDWTVTVTEKQELSSEKKILGFVLADETGDAVIDTVAFTVTAEVAYGTDLSALVPTIEVSAGATISPESGVAQDFSAGAVTYTVTAQDASTQDWTATVTEQQAVEVSSITALRAGNQDGFYKLTGEAILTAQMSYMNKKYIQDADAGILIFDPDGIITTIYNVGDGIKNLTGTLGEHADMLEFVPIEDPGAASSTGNTLIPLSVSISDLKSNFDNYESRLISIDGAVSFEDAAGTFANGTDYNIFNATDTTVLRTDFYDTDLTGTTIPAMAMVTGIAIEYYGTVEIAPRFKADVEEYVNAIEPLGNNLDILVYPNPSNGRFTLEWKNENAEDLHLEVLSMNGKVIYRDVYPAVSTMHRKIDLGIVPAGMYLLRARTDDQVSVYKLVIR